MRPAGSDAKHQDRGFRHAGAVRRSAHQARVDVAVDLQVGLDDHAAVALDLVAGHVGHHRAQAAVMLGLLRCSSTDQRAVADVHVLGAREHRDLRRCAARAAAVLQGDRAGQLPVGCIELRQVGHRGCGTSRHVVLHGHRRSREGGTADGLVDVGFLDDRVPTDLDGIRRTRRRVSQRSANGAGQHHQCDQRLFHGSLHFCIRNFGGTTVKGSP